MNYERILFGMKISDATSLAKVFDRSETLTTVILSGNIIDDDLLRMLMTGLIKNNTITSLDMSHNKITNHGARLLSKLLGENSVITSLNLADNQIYAEGGRYLARGLRENDSLLNLNMRLNRLTDDGILLILAQASNQEGNISVSGATVSYNGFTGSHWSRFIDESKPDVLRGTVMESLDQMTDWYAVEFEVSKTENDEVKTHTEHKPYSLKANEQEGDVITYNFEGTDYQATIVKEKDVKHVMSKISDTVEAKNVYGVFSAWDNDDLINNDFYVASVGSYVVRIKAGQTVSKGDLLQSNGDGTAKVQADDLVRASSFAKVLSNTVIETYEDGSFIVPCSLMC
jgi:Ran GTPase-activating protein (RanGAP) involved in mRNA processing and transport